LKKSGGKEESQSFLDLFGIWNQHIPYLEFLLCLTIWRNERFLTLKEAQIQSGKDITMSLEGEKRKKSVEK
jgi:hypothetical protein